MTNNDASTSNDDSSISIAITGSGGSGAITTGMVLLDAIAKAGYYGLMSRSLGPQIRGGESAAMVRFSAKPVACQDDSFDLLVGLDWANFSRFSEEINVNADSLIISGSAPEQTPAALLNAGAQMEFAPLNQLAKEIEGGRSNMVALGMVGKLCNLSTDALEEAVRINLAAKGQQVVDSAIDSIHRGFQSTPDSTLSKQLSTPVSSARRWNISGNEAGGLGALRGGIRFVAAYPITPASDMLEWLAPRLEKLDGTLLQAEDELASINMAIGASFGGVPAMTATSGPGLCLMTEGLGLAITAEIPLVIANVSRGGPSTGIPTKSEQSDLNLAIYGVHGDAPHLVLAPLSIADCANTMEWATTLAERLQTAAIVLTDQFLGQARMITDHSPPRGESAQRTTAEASPEPYLRYRLTSDGISPMALPGTSQCIHTAEGLEHNEQGLPSSMAKDHQAMLDKRRRKLEQFDYGDDWMESKGEGTICLLTWGSTAAVVFEAAERLRQQGLSVRTIALRLLAPLRSELLKQKLLDCERIVVVEQNHQAQFFHYLNAHQVLPANAESLAHPGPIPFRPGDITTLFKEATA